MVFSLNLQRYLAAITATAFLIAAASCTHVDRRDGTAGADSAVQAVEEYHADHDIAMTIRSVADAISVGEPLDTADYNFDGILTDGMGHPLYTDLQGNPGRWDVDVLSPTSVAVKNVDLGDLLPDDLEVYITGSMGMSEDNIVASKELDDQDDTRITVYAFRGGFLRFERRKGVSPNGLEGSLMRILASSEAPKLD